MDEQDLQDETDSTQGGLRYGEITEIIIRLKSSTI